MKLMLGDRELADVPNEVAEALLAIFERPGCLKQLPSLELRQPYDDPRDLMGSHLVQTAEAQEIDVTFSLTATKVTFGALHERRCLGRMMRVR